MAKDAAQVLEEALALPPEALAEAAWRKEVETRIADLDSGVVQSIDWAEVETPLRQRLND
jgi:Putative addiction module component